MTMEEMQRLLGCQQSRTDIMNLMGPLSRLPHRQPMSRIGRGCSPGGCRTPVRIRPAGRVRRKKIAGASSMP